MSIFYFWYIYQSEKEKNGPIQSNVTRSTRGKSVVGMKI